MRSSILFALAILAMAAPAAAQTCADRSDDYAARISLCDQAFEAAETAEDAAYALALKGEAERMLGQLDAAALTLQTALSYTPENAWVWVELGNVAFDRGDIAGALAHYSAALAVEDYATAWANRADAWWQYQNGQRCLDDADNALRVDPQFAYAHEVKGRCLIDLGRAEEALGAFDSAISLSPGYQNAYRNKMAALANLGRHQDVVAVADEALRPGVVPFSDPVIEEDIRSRRLLALAEYAPPETVAAEAEALVKLYPNSLAAVNIRARSLLEAGEFEAADAETAVLRANPDGVALDAVYLDTLAQIDVALGRFDAAYDNYAAAMTANPAISRDYARSLSTLGFLPLSNAAEGVLTALRRCLDVKKTACRVSL